MRAACYSFPKKKRIYKKLHFDYIFTNAGKIENYELRVYFKASFYSLGKVAVVAGKKSGNSVIRNKIKRRIREIYRNNQDKITTQYDFVLVGKRRILDKAYKEVDAAFIQLLEKNKFLKCSNH